MVITAINTVLQTRTTGKTEDKLERHSLECSAKAADVAKLLLMSDASRRPPLSSSSDIPTLVVPRTQNKFGDRSFSVVGPRV